MSTFPLLIVSRHSAAIDFIREELPQFAGAPVVPVATQRDVRGKSVAGNLPLALALHADCVYSIAFNGAPARDSDLSLAQMREHGARMVCTVTRPTPSN